MNAAHEPARRAVVCVLTCLMATAFLVAVPRTQAAGQPDPPPANGGPSSRDAGVAEGQRAAQADLDALQPDGDNQDVAAQLQAEDEQEINYLKLMLAGRWLMLPILAMSMLVVTFGVERMLSLRRRKVLPPELIEGLGRLAGQKGGLDPRQAYRLAQQFPSAAANVIKTMLLKVGRPHSEVEHAVSEANEREAAKLYANVRWLSLAAGVSPLLGLLGTVWGMIEAFFATANLPTGANKAEHLAQGIYTALVTTFAGLAVAIPAAVLAHWFEGWIQKLFRDLDETLLGLMPQLERFEGRLRVSRDQTEPATDELASESGDRRGHQAPAAEQGPKQPAATPK